MLKFKNTLLFYFLFIAICLLISYITKQRLEHITLAIAFRDFTLLSSLFAPTCLGGYYLIFNLNKKKIVSTSFFHRILRDFVLTIVISLGTIIILYVIRFYFFDNTKIENVLIKYINLFLINIIIIQFIEFYFYFIESKNRALRIEREKNKILQIQYQTLKEQINPHFLFNTLNTLSALIFDDQEKANRYTKTLAKLYRYILSTNQKQKISLDKEIDFLESYFYIQKLRFIDALFLDINYNPINLKDKSIVPLTLQILTENAIKHNVYNRESPLTIYISIDEHQIKVSNRKQVKTLKEDSTGKGLAYIKALYLVQNKEVSVLNENDNFTVIIPHLK